MSARKFLIQEPNGLFSLFISKQDQGYYVGSVMWYEKSGIWSKNTLQTEWHTEHFLENSHDEVFKAAKKWVIKNLGEPISIDEIQSSVSLT